MPSGGILPIVLAGKEDIHVSGNPDFAAFRGVIHRAVSFGMEPMRLSFDSEVNFGLTSVIKLPNVGDLFGQMWLRLDLPALGSGLSYVNNIGHSIIDEVQLEIDEQIVDRQTGEWMNWWSQLATSAAKQDGLNDLIGRNNAFSNDYTDAQVLWIPLYFWFCRHKGHYLPALALHGSEIRVRLKLRPLEQMQATTTSRATSVAISSGVRISHAELLTEVQYLDPEIRKIIAHPQRKQILIENVQVAAPISITAGREISHQRLRFKHPVKEIQWAVRQEENALQNEWFRQTNITVGSPDIGHTDMTNEVTLRVNGERLFDAQPARQFRVLLPQNQHTAIPDDFFYVFSWAQEPESINPSGTLNLSRATEFTMELALRDNTVIDATKALTFSAYALGQNMLIVENGIGTLKQLY